MGVSYIEFRAAVPCLHSSHFTESPASSSFEDSELTPEAQLPACWARVPGSSWATTRLRIIRSPESCHAGNWASSAALHPKAPCTCMI